eukprot:1150582-Pelagomonas_calceolata.AAC.1
MARLVEEWVARRGVSRARTGLPRPSILLTFQFQALLMKMRSPDELMCHHSGLQVTFKWTLQAAFRRGVRGSSHGTKLLADQLGKSSKYKNVCGTVHSVHRRPLKL